MLLAAAADPWALLGGKAQQVEGGAIMIDPSQSIVDLMLDYIRFCEEKKLSYAVGRERHNIRVALSNGDSEYAMAGIKSINFSRDPTKFEIEEAREIVRRRLREAGRKEEVVG